MCILLTDSLQFIKQTPTLKLNLSVEFEKSDVDLRSKSSRKDPDLIQLS